MYLINFQSVYVIGAAGYWLARQPKRGPHLPRRIRAARRQVIDYLAERRRRAIARELVSPST